MLDAGKNVSLEVNAEMNEGFESFEINIRFIFSSESNLMMWFCYDTCLK